MKTMKLFSMAAAALLMAACSNSDDFDVQKPAEIAGVYHFEATIAAPNADASMRTVYTEDGATINVKWKVGDQIALVHNGEVDVAEVKTVDDVTGKATIEATFKGSPSDDDDVTLAYPADAVVSATSYYPFPFTPNPDIFDIVKDQDGTLAYIQDNLDLRMGSGKLAVSGSDVSLKGSVSVSSLICIWKLTLQDESSNPLYATQLRFINNTATQAKATSAAKSEYYLCVVPSFIPYPSGTFSFVATAVSGTYTFSTTGLSLAAGKYYQSTVKMAKAPATAYTLAESTVGMIVGSNGKAYAAADKDNLPTGVTAAGMVAYKSGSNGLAIALADEASKMNWSTANGETGAAAHTPTVTGQTWKLPSKDEWDNMISAAGSYTDLRDGFSSVGGTNMKSDDRYWSSTEPESDRAWVYNFSNGNWGNGPKDFEYYVRACLAF